MKVPTGIRWPTTARAAIRIQQSLRERVQRTAARLRPRTIAGVDAGYEDDGATARAAVVVLDARTLAPIDCAIARRPCRFPYVPGLLSFRELPVVLAALRRLTTTPDLLLCDAQGYAHPRRFGLACHLGVLLDMPTIGVAKSRLTGEHGPLAPARGSIAWLTDRSETIGAAVRTRAGVAPVYVSIGHRVSLDQAIELVLSCAPRYRLPESTRWAHRLASSAGDVSHAIAAGITNRDRRNPLALPRVHRRV